MKKKLDCGCMTKFCRVSEHFFGTTFTTPKGGILTVTGLSDRKGKVKYYKTRCSICSEDTELFPDLFESKKDHLLGESVPCGCAFNPKWSKTQYEVLVKRECINRGTIRCHGIVRGGKGRYTKLKLECLEDGNRWNSTRIGDFLKGSGCPRCQRTAASDRLRTPQKEVETTIKRKCITEGITFIGFVGEYTSNRCKFNWTCAKGHSCQTGVCKFINGGRRCRTCADNDWGYFPLRAEDQDTLYLLKFTGIGLDGLLEIFIKVGRTFNFKDRMNAFKRSGYRIEVLATEQMTHKEVYTTEQAYHKIGKEHHYTPLVDFGGSVKECFTPEVMSLITLD